MFDVAGSEHNSVVGGDRGQVPTPEWQLNDQGRVAREMDALIGR
ncbi:hypothetical protein [Pararhizobium sp. IMCC21322]|nr:hypothetical protein [Pararhizobium sp. IMCC21322]